MKKWIKWGSVILVVVVVVSFVAGTYNSLIDRRMALDNSWFNVQKEYQRRADMVVDLLPKVRQCAGKEQQAVIDGIEQRARVTCPKVDFENLNDENLAKYQAAQSEIGSALNRLITLGEECKELRSSEDFVDLKDEMSVTDSRVIDARSEFNVTVKGYNAYLQKFPRNIVARMFGFTQKSFFAEEVGIDKLS